MFEEYQTEAHTRTIANNVLYHYNQGGYPGGSFTQSLLETINRADHNNLIRLATGFPIEVQLMELAMSDETGIDQLRAIAREYKEWDYPA